MRKLFKLPFTSSTNSSYLPSWRASKMTKSYLVLFGVLLSFSMFGQVDLADGQAAIEEAATGIEEYFEPIRNLVFIMAGIISLLGAIRVYMKWQMGDPDVMSTAASWFGSAIFLIVAVTVIQSFFGIG